MCVGLNVKWDVADTWCLDDSLCFGGDLWGHVHHGLSQCRGSCMVRPMLHTSVVVIRHSAQSLGSLGDHTPVPSVMCVTLKAVKTLQTIY